MLQQVQETPANPANPNRLKMLNSPAIKATIAKKPNAIANETSRMYLQQSRTARRVLIDFEIFSIIECVCV